MNADTRQQADTSAMAGPNSPVVLVTSTHAGHADRAAPAVLQPPGGHGGAAPGGGQGAYFMHALRLGLNVEFARLATDVARRERWGTLTYAASALEALAQFQPVPVTLRLFGVVRQGADGDRMEMGGDVIVMRRALQVAVVNLPVFGGPLNLRLPNAWLGDSLLDIVVIEALEPPNLRATVDGLFAAFGR